MNTFVITVGIFILTFSAHSIVHRWMQRIRYDPLISLTVYIPGGCVMCAYVLLRPSHYVFTSLVLYMLLALTASLFYLGPYLGGETPASMILASFKKKKRQTEADLMHLFTDSGLFWKRVDDLKRSGLIEVRRAKYITTTKGRASIYCISLYQRVFHRSMTE